MARIRKGSLVMVLSDGETYMGLDDCRIVLVADDVLADIESGDASEADFDGSREGTKVIATFEEITRGRSGEPYPVANIGGVMAVQVSKGLDPTD